MKFDFTMSIDLIVSTKNLFLYVGDVVTQTLARDENMKKTMEPQKLGNPTRPKSHVVERERVSRERAGQAARS